jgi:hypothetical protein
MAKHHLKKLAKTNLHTQKNNKHSPDQKVQNPISKLI